MFKERKPLKKPLSKYDKRLPKTILRNAFVGSRTAARFKILIKFRRKCKKKQRRNYFVVKWFWKVAIWYLKVMIYLSKYTRQLKFNKTTYLMQFYTKPSMVLWFDIYLVSIDLPNWDDKQFSTFQEHINFTISMTSSFRLKSLIPENKCIA